MQPQSIINRLHQINTPWIIESMECRPPWKSAGWIDLIVDWYTLNGSHNGCFTRMQVTSNQPWLNWWNAGHIEWVQAEWVGYMLNGLHNGWFTRMQPQSIRNRLHQANTPWIIESMNAGHQMQVEWIWYMLNWLHYVWFIRTQAHAIIDRLHQTNPGWIHMMDCRLHRSNAGWIGWIQVELGYTMVGLPECSPNPS